MNSIIYVGMDVHKKNFTLCCYSFDEDELKYKQTIKPDYKLVLKYFETVRKRYPDKEIEFVCGYEAGSVAVSFGAAYSIPASLYRLW